MSLFVFNSLNLPSTRIPRQWPPEATHEHSIFGQKVLWCPVSRGGSHFAAEELEPYRHVGDFHLDDLLERLDREGVPLTAGGDLLELIDKVEQGYYDSQLSDKLRTDLISFLAKYKTVPQWVNVQQLERGRQVFLMYAPAMGASLYYRSLVPGFSIPQLAAVVQSTGYLAPPASQEQVSNRLMDTGAMVSACMVGSIESLFDGGDGWKAALHVRVLHAKVRRRLMQRQGSKRWDVALLGVPINQEDMGATLLAFSINTLYGVEFIAGVQLSRQDQLDYLALWRYIGWLLGVPTATDDDDERTTGGLRPLDPCGPGWNVSKGGKGDPVFHSRSVLESIIAHLMKPNESSVVVARHLLAIGRTKPDKKADSKGESKRLAWFYFRCLQCRRFIGDPLADALRLPLHPSWWKRWLLFAASTLYLWLLRLYTLATMYVPPIQWRIQQYHANMSSRFYDTWKDSHPTRMAKALRQESVGESKRASCCPFAMVAPPQY